jgi:hypothetical protein
MSIAPSRCAVRGHRPGRVGGVAAGARQRAAVRRQRLQRDDPGREGGEEVLGQERAQRHRFPGLHVARRPVVQQAQAEGMVLGRVDADRLAERVAGADEDAQFQFVVQALRGAEDRRLGPRRAHLAQRAMEAGAADGDRRRAAVVADRQPLEIGQHGRVGLEQAARVQCVIGGREEVGVVADVGGQRMGRFTLGQQAVVQPIGLGHRVAQQARQRQPQGRPRGRPLGHQRVQRRAAGLLGRFLRGAAKGAARDGCRQVQDHVADGHAHAPRLGASYTAEDAVWQVLDREVAARVVGGCHPAAQGGIVGLVEHGRQRGR